MWSLPGLFIIGSCRPHVRGRVANFGGCVSIITRLDLGTVWDSVCKMCLPTHQLLLAWLGLASGLGGYSRRGRLTHGGCDCGCTPFAITKGSQCFASTPVWVVGSRIRYEKFWTNCAPVCAITWRPINHLQGFQCLQRPHIHVYMYIYIRHDSSQ